MAFQSPIHFAYTSAEGRGGSADGSVLLNLFAEPRRDSTYTPYVILHTPGCSEAEPFSSEAEDGELIFDAFMFDRRLFVGYKGNGISRLVGFARNGTEWERDGDSMPVGDYLHHAVGRSAVLFYGTGNVHAVEKSGDNYASFSLPRGKQLEAIIREGSKKNIIDEMVEFREAWEAIHDKPLPNVGAFTDIVAYRVALDRVNNALFSQDFYDGDKESYPAFLESAKAAVAGLGDGYDHIISQLPRFASTAYTADDDGDVEEVDISRSRERPGMTVHEYYQGQIADVSGQASRPGGVVTDPEGVGIAVREMEEGGDPTIIGSGNFPEPLSTTTGFLSFRIARADLPTDQEALWRFRFETDLYTYALNSFGENYYSRMRGGFRLQWTKDDPDGTIRLYVDPVAFTPVEAVGDIGPYIHSVSPLTVPDAENHVTIPTPETGDVYFDIPINLDPELADPFLRGTRTTPRAEPRTYQTGGNLEIDFTVDEDMTSAASFMATSRIFLAGFGSLTENQEQLGIDLQNEVDKGKNILKAMRESAVPVLEDMERLFNILNTGLEAPQSATWQDGYFIVLAKDTERLNVSRINQLVFRGQDVASAQSRADNGVAVISCARKLYVLGESTIELWYNQGRDDFPFGRYEGAVSERGCASAESVQRLDNSIYFVTDDGRVARTESSMPIYISTNAIEDELRKGDYSKAVATMHNDGSHQFYTINVPGLDKSLSYDVSTGFWHYRQSEGGHWRFSRLVQAGHETFGIDGQRLGLLSRDPTEYGLPVRRVAKSTIIHNQSNVLQWRRVQITLDSPDLDSVVKFDYTDDRGLTWSNPIAARFPQSGANRNTMSFPGLGASAERSIRLTFEEATPVVIIRAYASLKRTSAQSTPG